MAPHLFLYVFPFLLLGGFLVYWAGSRHAYARRRPAEPGDATAWDWHFFVPCRDEEAVIATTVDRLRGDFPASCVWVIDDASDDRTGEIVAALAAEDARIRLVTRRRPEARIGKGAALNAAYEALDAELGEDADRSRVVVCVVDADGRLSPDALAYVSGPDGFGDPETGGVQIGVRMRNVDDERPRPGRGRAVNAYARLLIRMQDAEFAVSNTGMQLLRCRTGSVGLGGNGQFTRLSALDRIAAAERRPWKQDALLEDYELGLHMRLAGYRVTHIADTWVTQEALPYTRRFLTQRTRWAQGNIQCVRYATRIIGSRHYRARGVLESLYTFVQPLAHLTVLVLTVVLLSVLATGLAAGTVLLAAWPLALALGILSIVPFLLWGPVYRREFAPNRSRAAGVLWGITLWLYAYHLFIVSTRGSVRLARGRTGWAKTRRNAETAVVGPTATES
ncbi:glycosyltransferase [Streptomyces bacillaris]|uniref:Glycosyltransferase n=1 Tax=Streptomyces cavourensis TaxID=67258 RepID=A0AAD0Q407_9ACTN|nr:MULTISPECIES: glycosyltransferase [Streptomyces]NUW22539.1 glycosyltransferase [Streptomyces roseoviolaceus]AXI71778.1 glycosyltransferase [Streptomyces cavourensis]NUV40100.1 glycosyltransferase [Streptomyces sp. CAI-24]NUV89183.1 glycosyltransferase [Streptomyces sp. KAI-26]WAE66326.1 glycosyltransferase [Streptomyces cavourensis]